MELLMSKVPNDNKLITRRCAHGYSRQGVVWCGAAREVTKMRELLRDLYFGNIVPSARQITPSSNLQRELERVSQSEKRLRGQLNEADGG